MSASFDFRSAEIHVFVGEDGVLVTYLVDEVLSEMRRARDETLEKTFLRLDKNLSKKMSKKSKAKTKIASSGKAAGLDSERSIELRLELNDQVVDASLLLASDLKTGMTLTVSCGTKYFIVVAPPKVTDIVVFPKQLTLVGYPLIATGYAQLDGSEIEYLWHVEASHNEWVLRGNNRIYTPCEADIGKQVKVYCTPKHLQQSTQEYLFGRSAVHYIPGKVKRATPITPASKILQIRQEFIKCQHRESGQLRLVTFNILADQYASTVRAANTLFDYCPPEYLNIDYRCQLVMEELLAYDADVVCLQECDAKLFHSYYSPMLTSYGYQGCYTNKSSSVNEGCAAFINTKRLSLLRVIDVPIKKILGVAPYLEGIYSHRPDLRDVLGNKIGGIGQICVCRSDTGRILLVANTHLFFHPLAGFVRLLQIDGLLKAVSSLKAEIESNGLMSVVARTWCVPGLEGCDMYEGANEGINNQEVLLSSNVDGVSVIVAGDLNSVANSAVIEYLQRGIISSNHDLWLTINGFRWGIDDEGNTMSNSNEPAANNGCYEMNASHLGTAAVEGRPLTPTLINSLGLRSAAGFPQYTNFTRDFKDLLDYILIPGEMKVVDVAPFPSLEDLTENIALPSMRFPSDHVSVALDVTFE